MDDDTTGPEIEFDLPDVNGTVRELLTVANVALGEGMPEIEPDDALDLLKSLQRVVDRAMPEGLQSQDARVARARELLLTLRVTHIPGSAE